MQVRTRNYELLFFEFTHTLIDTHTLSDWLTSWASWEHFSSHCTVEKNKEGEKKRVKLGFYWGGHILYVLIKYTIFILFLLLHILLCLFKRIHNLWKMKKSKPHFSLSYKIKSYILYSLRFESHFNIILFFFCTSV